MYTNGFRSLIAPFAGICVLVSTGIVATAFSASAADPCTAPTNPILCENSKAGTPDTVWDVSGGGDDSIQGFATDASVNVGSSISFKVKTTASAYTIDVYRLGYYDNKGARLITPLTPTNRVQPTCLSDSSTGLFDCGNWLVSATWNVPSTAVSGTYVARLTRTDDGGASLVPFVVRNDASTSDLLFQTADTTWQAYNAYGGNSFYEGANGRAYKVSYNRPVSTHGQNSLFAYEYPMIRFLEANGYDVSYTTDLDSDRRGSLIKNHKTFVTAGHDEYWSGQQRANVKSARDAGVNMAFFAGNDVYWKTRWESSIDPSGTVNRTLVCYKETWDNAKIDPNAQWTGTWRDPRFSPPADGGLPENELVGTAYMSNFTDLAIEVPAADGRMRLWRNTTVATLATGATATLAPHTIGYESNEDLDNGFRPPGLIRLSSTTGPTPEYLRDYGSTVTPGTTEHHLTMYKAASGALVFSAGTIQWSWGLDANHDNTEVTPDDRMRQATVNLFADMSAQPLSLQSGLTLATKSTDTTAPTSAITSPAAGAALTSGTTVNITGTAADSGAGKVGGIEVSTDGGQLWHPAQGRESWTYAWTVGGIGSVNILVRATDDSGNIQGAPVSRTVTVSCPCSLFSGQTPMTASANDSSEVEVGVRFRSQQDGWISGIRFYKGATNTGTHTGSLWSTSGTKLATGTFTGETATGWQTLNFPNAVPVTAATNYVASYHAPNGGYAADSQFFVAKATVQPPLTALKSTDTEPNGVYESGPTAFPVNTFKATNYWVTPIFDTVEPPDITPPAVVAVSPADGSSSVKVTKTPTITFSEPITAGSLTVKLSSSAGQVAGSLQLDTDRKIATFTPAANLANSTTYTLAVSGATDAAGNTLTATSTTFRTAMASTPGVCPCSIWSDSDVPDDESVNDANAVELGVKFQADTNGFVAGIRFYKGPGNAGTHTGTLWSATGTELATATFAAESTSGWQEVRFSSRVAVTAGQTYVASYHAAQGHYAATGNGLAQAVTNSPLTALADGSSGGNGVYKYGARAFPSNGTAANYWVDVVFELPPDVTAPAVSSLSPAAGATNALITTRPRATFTETVTGVSGSLTGPGGAVVPSTTTMDAANRTATITPTAALQPGTTYQARVSGARDAAGNVMVAPFTWSFTTGGVASCPCTLYPSDYVPAVAAANDSSALELGVRFTPAVDGQITSVRFYKGTGNTGTHTGSLWVSGGGLITTGTFSAETASGWQQMTFASPVAVTAGTAYVASYSAPNGHYSADSGQLATSWTNGPLTAAADVGNAPNGVFSNGVGLFPNQSYQSTGYGVDVVFEPVTLNATPSVPATTPAPTPTTAGPTTPAPTTAAPTTVPPTTVPPTTATSTLSTLSHTSTADFAAGTQSNTIVSDRAGGGHVTLAPTVAQEFSGTTVPANWASTSLAATSSVAVAGGAATVSGRTFRLSTTFATGRELDAVATLKAVNGQWLGVTDDDFSGASDRWAAFRTTSTGGLAAQTQNGTAGSTTTNLAAGLLGVSHRYEIEWTATSTVFRVDGVTVATQARGISVATRIAVQDATVDGNPLVLDSVWLSPYAASGTFTSAVLNAGVVVDWRNLTPTAITPSGTAITYQVRTGPSATAGGTGWSGWTTVAAGGDVPGNTRYLQYRATLSTGANRNSAPALAAVQFGYAGP